MDMEARYWASEVAAASMLEKMENLRRSIQVLVVDHETNAHASLINMLEHFFLKVTIVKYASTGLAMLSKGKATFGLLLANIHSPDTCGYKLLQEAVRIDLPVILMLEKDDVMLTKGALEAGALLCMKKPITVETVRYFWQLVMYWEKTQTQTRTRTRTQSRARSTGAGTSTGRERELMMMMYDNNNGNNNYYISNHQNGRDYSRIMKSEGMDGSWEHDEEEIGSSLRTKVWTEWTQQLHDNFMAAVASLGPARCYPKDILEKMNVPGLTRMQVASHLQKCRSGAWIAPSERNPKTSTAAAKRRLCIANSTQFASIPNSNNPNQHSEYLHHHFPNVDSHTIQNFDEIPMTGNAVKMNVKVEICENDEGKSQVVVKEEQD